MTDKTSNTNDCEWEENRPEVEKAMNKKDFVNRLQGRLPKIGIRPTIDGRRKGVRESLEEKTMGMAKSLGEFLSSTLRHSCGNPVFL